jgi:electron transfer flavoprotein beta subunit
MNIIVLVKQVPNTTEIQINKETGTLIRDNVKSIINPDDLAGIEEALKLKERFGGSITVITMGPKSAESMLREIYGYGVDEVVLISDKLYAGSDTLATSTILSTAIVKYDFDIIIAGRQAIDGDTAQVGPQIASLLDINQVTYIKDIKDISYGSIILERVDEHYNQIIECPMPLLITTLKESNTPRYPNVTDLWNGFDKNITVLTNQELNIDQSVVGLKGSPTKVKKTYTKTITQKSTQQELNPKEAASLIISALSEHI